MLQNGMIVVKTTLKIIEITFFKKSALSKGNLDYGLSDVYHNSSPERTGQRMQGRPKA